MPPRSPTQAFDPTPALEHHPDNFSPLNTEPNMMTVNGTNTNGNGGFKEVHFDDRPAPILARHSIATTNVPLLPSVSSASRMPKQSFMVAPPGVDMNAYMENCRNLNEQLRQAHETERKAWDIERSALLARIADLEFRLNRSRDPKRRSSNDSSAASAHSFRSDFRSQYEPSKQQPNGLRAQSDSSVPPIWQGPETTPPVTRVFSNDESDVSHLPSISEDAEPFPDLSKEISPTTREEPHPVDVSTVDSTLEGITLKSTGPALTSSFSTKITSPQFGSPLHTPSPRPTNRPPSNTLMAPPTNLTLDTSKLLDPLDKKLKLHAGHTPMALDGAIALSDVPTEQPTPKTDDPPEPAPTKRPPLRPSEDSDTYFSLADNIPRIPRPDEAIKEEPEQEPNFDNPDDPALKGPLMLDPAARSQAAESFLEKVDAKLSDIAAHSRLRSDTSTTDGSEAAPVAEAKAEEIAASSDNSNSNGQGHVKNKDSMDDLPRLRIKKSTNFGSAWGGDMPGRNF